MTILDNEATVSVADAEADEGDPLEFVLSVVWPDSAAVSTPLDVVVTYQLRRPDASLRDLARGRPKEPAALVWTTSSTIGTTVTASPIPATTATIAGADL